MSNVMRPRGPLPARIYWTRRLLLVGVLAIAVAVGWWLLPSGRGPGSASADPGGQRPSTPAGTSSTHLRSGDHRPAHRHTKASTAPPSAPVHTAPPPVSVPTGPCDPAKLELGIVPRKSVVGKGTRIALALATRDGSTCTLGITPSRLEVMIRTGDVTVWKSTQCPDRLPARNVVVGAKSSVVYSFRWDGHVDLHGCAIGSQVAQDGTYWVTAAFVGGQPREVSFIMVPESSAAGL